MDNFIDKVSSMLAPINYAIGSGLYIGNAMHYLNDNAGAFGVIIGFMTFFAQLYFGSKRQEILIKKLEGHQSSQARRKTDNLNNQTF